MSGTMMDSYQIVPIQGENPYELDLDTLERFLQSPDHVPTANNSRLEIKPVSDPDPDDPLTWNLDFNCLDFPDEIPGQGTMAMGVDQLGSVYDSGNNSKNKVPVGLSSDCETQMQYYYYEDSSIPEGREQVHTGSVNANMLSAVHPISVWPQEPRPINCSCCQVLREIVHSDGGICFFSFFVLPISIWLHLSCDVSVVMRVILYFLAGRITTKLEIHGRVGMISHAILESHQYFTDRPPESYFQIIELVSSTAPSFSDSMQKTKIISKFSVSFLGVKSLMLHRLNVCSFTNKSLEEVKHLTKEYCIGKEREGFFMEQDNFSKFYEAVCVGYDWNDILEVHSPTVSADEQQLQQAPWEENEVDKQDRTYLSLQRERAAKLKVKDLAEYFDYPIQKASEMLNLCCTVLKRKCRQEGVQRWPHRKVKSLKKQMEKVRAFMESNNHSVVEYARLQGSLENLQQQLDVIFTRGY
ncbi:Protein RKD4 [Linum perenne]